MVMVPVLSRTIVLSFAAFSSASLLLKSMPFSAPFPVPAIMAVGVARPKAQGHAITRTATILIIAGTNSPSMPHHMKNVITAERITAGTKNDDTRSASACMGALLPCASWTSLMICARAVFFPTLVAVNFKRPWPLTVPPVTTSFSFLSTGRGSPVSMDSSTDDMPSIIIPSTGILSPGRITTISPSFTAEIGTCFSSSFSSMVAVLGTRPISFFMAPPVLPFVLASSSLPNLIRVIITADVSKYTWLPSTGNSRTAME